MIFFYSSSANSPWYVPILCVLLPLALQSGYGGLLGPLGVLLGPASYTSWQPSGVSTLAQFACLTTAVAASFFICTFLIGLSREVRRNGLRHTLSALRQRPVRRWPAYLNANASSDTVRPQRSAGAKPESHQARFEAVSKRVQQLPTELYLSRNDLERLPLHSLKARLIERGVKVLPGEGLDRQDAIRMALETGGSSRVSCGVCCEDYESQDVLRKLPYCGHRFHLECIDRWLLSSTDYSQRPSSCPICNSEI